MRYSIGKKLTGTIKNRGELKIILARSIHGFIVNQVASDGTQEFISRTVQMVTIKAKTFFKI